MPEPRERRLYLHGGVDYIVKRPRAGLKVAWTVSRIDWKWDYGNRPPEATVFVEEMGFTAGLVYRDDDGGRDTSWDQTFLTPTEALNHACQMIEERIEVNEVNDKQWVNLRSRFEELPHLTGDEGRDA